MVEERALERWFALEMTRFHRSFVASPRSVADLVGDATPTAATRGGELHAYDRATLRRIHDALTPLDRRRVRLPATFFVDKDLPSDAHVADEPTIALLRALGEIPASTQPREGKLWLGLSRAQLIAQRHPTAFQFIHF